MKKWEYKVLIGIEAECLKDLGELGWELVSVVERYFYFKRPLTPLKGLR